MESAALRQLFLDQGERFIELTDCSFTHMRMSGRTLDEPPQDINAQVIVDMAIALINNPDLRPESKVLED